MSVLVLPQPERTLLSIDGADLNSFEGTTLYGRGTSEQLKT